LMTHHLISSATKQVAATLPPILPTVAATWPSFSCRGGGGQTQNREISVVKLCTSDGGFCVCGSVCLAQGGRRGSVEVNVQVLQTGHMLQTGHNTSYCPAAVRYPTTCSPYVPSTACCCRCCRLLDFYPAVPSLLHHAYCAL
jgi:hypothetical protein